MDINFKQFPVTRYQGSKRKIAYWICEILSEINCNYETVLDGFGGTGTVSYLFKKLNKSVTYNDNLKFNYLIGKALIENQTIRLEDEVGIKAILNYESTEATITNHFQEFYFLDHENEWLDNIIGGIKNQFHSDGADDLYSSAIAYYALFQACLIKRPFNLFHRKNLYIRTNDVPRNFGNKTSWEKPFEDLFRKFLKEANETIFDNNKACYSSNQSVFDVEEHFDLVYLDPPYFVAKDNHETSDYFKCYHFLEGLANYNDWTTKIDFNSNNRRLKHDHQLVLDKKNITTKIEELIYKFKNSIIVFSYKEGGVPSINFIVEMLEKLNKKVFIKSIHYKYALNRQNGDASKNREVLIVAI